jgi:hypothetical protein
MSLTESRRKLSPRCRSTRRQLLVLHLHRCGPRPVLEALIEVSQGNDVDETLERYAAIPSDVYHQLGADQLPAFQLSVVKGGRR